MAGEETKEVKVHQWEPYAALGRRCVYCGVRSFDWQEGVFYTMPHLDTSFTIEPECTHKENE